MEYERNPNEQFFSAPGSAEMSPEDFEAAHREQPNDTGSSVVSSRESNPFDLFESVPPKRTTTAPHETQELLTVEEAAKIRLKVAQFFEKLIGRKKLSESGRNIQMMYGTLNDGQKASVILRATEEITGLIEQKGKGFVQEQMEQVEKILFAAVLDEYVAAKAKGNQRAA